MNDNSFSQRSYLTNGQLSNTNSQKLMSLETAKAHLTEVLSHLKDKKGYRTTKEMKGKEEVKMPSGNSILGKRKAAPTCLIDPCSDKAQKLPPSVKNQYTCTGSYPAMLAKAIEKVN